MSSIAARSRKPIIAAGAAALGVAVVPAVAMGETANAGQASASSPPAAKSAAAGHKHKSRKSRRPMRARLTKRGNVIAPANAPWQVRRVIQAANRISHKPYIWGGGHGGFYARGYDCSGSVSYALHGGNLLSRPMTSSSLAGYGRGGHGKWITIYAHGGHTYMVVAGMRFDTSARKWSKSRWTKHWRSPRGYVVRHPRGL
jgi:cell wall-associated NlpC family hydrolase